MTITHYGALQLAQFSIDHPPGPDWINERNADARIVSDLFAINSFTAGSLVFANASGKLDQNNANLFWDVANRRLGLGTASPTTLLEVNGSATIKKLLFPFSALTIASDTITVTGSHHTVDTEAAAATDNLTTISGGSAGQLLFLRTVNAGRDITIVDNNNGGNNIRLVGNVNFTLTDTDDLMVLFSPTGATWYEVARLDIG